MPDIDVSQMNDCTNNAKISPAVRDQWIREVAAEVERSDNYGMRFAYSVCGNSLIVAMKHDTGHVQVYEATLTRSQHFAPEGTVI